jgi:hypothetical protein
MLRQITLALIAVTVVGTIATAPPSASAANLHARYIVSGSGGLGWGYGRGWCYWHPYSCYRY